MNGRQHKTKAKKSKHNKGFSKSNFGGDQQTEFIGQPQRSGQLFRKYFITAELGKFGMIAEALVGRCIFKGPGIS